MSHCPKPLCPTSNVFDPPKVVYRDHYHPQIVNVIHQVEVVNRHHCVPVPRHVYCYSERNEYPSASAMPFGPYRRGR
ncbi:hypothetical protein GCM10020370_24370 [Paenibacillus hodogayensis]